ncbi:MAG TPA: hypothetical protein VGN80_01890 [Devosiaceae bacterium]|nr:hypothetical protein [Devosiaceae bacterium]
MRAVVTMFVVLACFSSPILGSENDPYERGLHYVSSLPADLNIYVWPTRIRPYEIIGDNKAETLETVSRYINKTKDMFLLTHRLSFPMISLLLYDSGKVDPYKKFLEQSDMSSAYKKGIANINLTYDGCAFTSVLSRRTWAAGGVVFVDIARIVNPMEQMECLHAALDYINGFPAPTKEATHRDLPSADVRKVVLAAITRCSEEGVGGADEERSRDGLTPLPPLSCIKAWLKEGATKRAPD